MEVLPGQGFAESSGEVVVRAQADPEKTLATVGIGCPMSRLRLQTRLGSPDEFQPMNHPPMNVAQGRLGNADSGVGSVADGSAERRDPWTYAVLGAAMADHNELGRGFQEPVFREALGRELALLGIPQEVEVPLPVLYRVLR